MSPPVPTDAMLRRIDKLAELGTSVVAFSGGEPMLHPDLDVTDPPHPQPRHDGRPDHQRLLPRAEADRGAERGRARLPADQHRQHRAGRGVEEEPAAARQEAAAPQGSRDLRRQHQLGARRRDQEPRGRADDQQPRARARLLHLDRHHPRRLGTAEAARAGRAQGVRRGLGRDQRRRAGVEEPVFGDPQLPGQPGGRQAQRVALPRRARATCISARTGWSTTARSSAAIPGVPLESYTIADIRREFDTPKSCAPYCTVGCVHRVSTMDFWRSPQDARVGHQRRAPDGG